MTLIKQMNTDKPSSAPFLICAYHKDPRLLCSIPHLLTT